MTVRSDDLADNLVLDEPTEPESLVAKVSGDFRYLVETPEKNEPEDSKGRPSADDLIADVKRASPGETPLRVLFGIGANPACAAVLVARDM
jgi:hypothetical protein